MSKKSRIAEVLGVVVLLLGLVVMLGWIFDISVLKSILPVWVTMKFSTALCFFLSGFTLYFIASSQVERFSSCSNSSDDDYIVYHADYGNPLNLYPSWYTSWG